MKIIIFDGTFKTTTFINRLIKGLSTNHQVFVLGFDEKIQTKLENVKYVGLGSNASKLLFVKRSIQLRGFHLIKQVQLFLDLLRSRKKKIKEQNVQLAVHYIQPDIIHFQWVSVLPYLKSLQLPKHCKTVFSQRGFHINIRPFVDKENQQFLQQVFPKIDAFHSVSRAIQKKSNQIYQQVSKIDQVVYSGFDIDRFPKKVLSTPSETFQVLTVGRSHWIKDYKTALMAMHILKKSGFTFRYTLLGVQHDEELLYLTQDLGFQKNVIFVAQVSQQEVYDYMMSSDLLLMSSIEEGIANVCIEAMFCELLVLSTNCGGMSELIKDGENGFLVPTRNPQAIAEQIKYIMGLTKEKKQTMIDSAKARVEEQHTTKKMVDGMINLYKSVIAS